MGLSGRHRRALARLDRRFHATDPVFAGKFTAWALTVAGDPMPAHDVVVPVPFRQRYAGRLVAVAIVAALAGSTTAAVVTGTTKMDPVCAVVSARTVPHCTAP